MKIGMIFPGYGSQYVGMCKELYDNFRVIQEYFEEASNCLNNNLIKLCFASSDAELSKMHNAYPALFLVGASIAALLKKENIEPAIVAGYNTGEYAALYTANGLSFPDGLYVLNKYAVSFQEMLDELKDIHVIKIIGIAVQDLEPLRDQICKEGQALYMVICQALDEHLLCGSEAAIEQLRALLKEYSGIKIKVQVPEIGLHSILMDPVVGRLSMYLEKVDFHDLDRAWVSSVSGELIQNGAQAKISSIEAIKSTLYWYKTLAGFDSCDCILEIGPSDSWLHSNLQTWYPHKQIITVNKPEDIQIVKSVCLNQTIQTMESADEHI